MVINYLKKFEYSDWEAHWSGKWPILSFSYWGPFYSAGNFSDVAHQYVHRSIIIWNNGKSTGYQRESEKKEFSNHLISVVKKDKKFAVKLCSNLKKKTDDFLQFVNLWIGKDISLQEFRRYNEILFSYYRYHIPIKVIVDYLPPELLKVYLPSFEEARVYAEPVFTKSIEFINALSELHAQKSGFKAELIRAMVKEEFELYLKTGQLPNKKMLTERNKKSVYLFLEGKRTRIMVGDEQKSVEKILISGRRDGVLRGMTAYPGKVRGRVKIILDPDNARDFIKGNILVTGMTRPEYLPLIKKASAIVTDAGGILSHAAITARELKKPCVIGTQTATQQLHDGDMVEVDANKGIVKKL